ncbi:MAG: glycosyltransferase [Acidimicrobiales bacterium]
MVNVRVGIVSWNTAALLDRCLDALPAALGDLDAEVVVVDNASADGSVAVAGRHRDVTVVAGGENVGYARAMNRALAGVPAPFLIALNPDTVPPPGSLARLVATMAAHPDAALVAPRLLNTDGSLQRSVHRFPSLTLAAIVGFVPQPLRRGRLGRRWWLEEADPAAYQGVVEVDWAIGAVHCIRAAALGNRPPYSERWFMYAEDMDLCWQLRGRGWSVILDGSVTVTHVGNAAGAVAFADRREAQSLVALYDWYRQARGPSATRAWAGVNLVAHLTKLAVVRGAGMVAPSRRASLGQRAILRPGVMARHWRALRTGGRPELGANSRARACDPHTGTGEIRSWTDRPPQSPPSRSSRR